MKVKASGIVAAVLLAVLAATPFVSNAADLPAAFEGTSTLQADGVVKSINQAQRSLTVLDAQGRIRYHGGIDSDKSRLHEDAQLYLRDAVEDVLETELDESQRGSAKIVTLSDGVKKGSEGAPIGAASQDERSGQLNDGRRSGQLNDGRRSVQRDRTCRRRSAALRYCDIRSNHH